MYHIHQLLLMKNELLIYRRGYRPIYIAEEMLDYSSASSITGINSGADYYSTFDFTDHILIYVILRKFGFKENFLNWSWFHNFKGDPYRLF